MLRNFPADRNPASAPCPSCGVVGTLRPHGKYKRWLRLLAEEPAELVDVDRRRCSDCGKTHAVLPEGCVPYCALGACVTAAICLAKREGAKVAEVCERFGISVRTLYRILGEREAPTTSMLAAVDAAARLGDLASEPSSVRLAAGFVARFERMPFEKVTLSRSRKARPKPSKALHKPCASTRRAPRPNIARVSENRDERTEDVKKRRR